MTNLRRFTAEMHIAELQQKVTEATANNNIKMVAAEYAQLLLKNKEINKGMQLTDAQIQKIQADIKNAFTMIEISQEHANIEKAKLKLEQDAQTWEHGSGSLIHGAVDRLMGIIPALIERKGTKGGKH